MYSDPSGETVGTECVAGILGAGLGPQRLNPLFAFINLDQESDGAIRRGRTFYPDRSGGGRLTWAASSVAKYQRKPEAVQRFWLDYSVKTAQFQRISWKDAGTRRPGDLRIYSATNWCWSGATISLRKMLIAYRLAAGGWLGSRCRRLP